METLKKTLNKPKKNYRPKKSNQPPKEEHKLTSSTTEASSITKKSFKKNLTRWQVQGSEQCSDIVTKLRNRELECMICMNQIGWRGKI